MVDSSGQPRVGAKAHFYKSGTSTEITTYSDPSYSTAHANPVLSVAGGLFPAVYVNPSVNSTYKMVITDADGVSLYSEDNIPAMGFTQADIGAVLYPTTSTETSASITPSDNSYPSGNIWRYGATGDGTTDDTDAFANMLKSGAPVLILENGVFSISGNQTLSKDGTRLICRNATLKLRDETGISDGEGLLNVSADDCYIDVRIDFNQLGLTGVRINGDRNYVRAVGSNMYGSADSVGNEALVSDVGNDNTIWAEGYDLDNGDATNPSCPRVVQCGGTTTGSTIEMLKGRNVACALLVNDTDGVVVNCVDVDTVTDNGFYLLSSSKKVKICGGRLKDAVEPFAILGTDIEICNLDIYDPSLPITISSVTRVACRNVRMFRSSDVAGSSFISTRSTNTISEDVTLENCYYDSPVGEAGIAAFGTGKVNGFKVLGGYYRLTWTDDTPDGGDILIHEEGDQVIYKDVTVQLEDAKGTPLTGTDLLEWDIPELSADSIWDNVRIINNTSGQERVGTTGGILQSNLFVRDDGFLRPELGPHIKSLDSAVKRIVWSNGAPSAGTWAANDRVFHTDPGLGEPAGWVCTSAGTPGTWSPFGQVGYRTTTAAPTVNAKYVGEELLDTTNKKWYKAVSTGSGSSDWVAMN